MQNFHLTINSYFSFKPCYKWITFNTQERINNVILPSLGFKPCYKWITFNTQSTDEGNGQGAGVLNLVINGLPSIQDFITGWKNITVLGFKPCYKWITFNTKVMKDLGFMTNYKSFKPCYKWITFNTL